MQASKAQVLERMLQYWEDSVFMLQFENLVKTGKAEGASGHWPSFRKYARAFRPGDTFDLSKYGTVPEHFGTLGDIPPLITAWISQSKRVFKLSPEMQKRLEVIKFGNMRMSDIKFPFSSFAVELSNEMTDDGGNKFDFFLVSDYQSSVLRPGKDEYRGLTMLHTFSAAKTDYVGITPEKKVEILKHVQSGYNGNKALIRDATYLREKALEGARRVAASQALLFKTTQDLLVEKYLEQIAEKDLSPVDVTRIRMVLNLCAYLQSLPAKQRGEEGAKWKEETAHKAVCSENSIARTTNICDIVGKHILDSMILGKDGKRVTVGGWELPPHWRRAHSRRPPGKGGDPLAPKTVDIPQTLVRPDLWDEYGGPQGSVGEVRK